MVVTGYDDRHGCGYVLSTGADAVAGPGSRTVAHGGLTVSATPELAGMLLDALQNRPTAQLGWTGPEVTLTLDDSTLLAWLTHTVGGVLTVSGATPQRGSAG